MLVGLGALLAATGMAGFRCPGGSASLDLPWCYADDGFTNVASAGIANFVTVGVGTGAGGNFLTNDASVFEEGTDVSGYTGILPKTDGSYLLHRSSLCTRAAAIAHGTKRVALNTQGSYYVADVSARRLDTNIGAAAGIDGSPQEWQCFIVSYEDVHSGVSPVHPWAISVAQESGGNIQSVSAVFAIRLSTTRP